MGVATQFPNERLRWMDDLLNELQGFSERYHLADLETQLRATRQTLHNEALRVNDIPDHPIHAVRGPREN